MKVIVRATNWTGDHATREGETPSAILVREVSLDDRLVEFSRVLETPSGNVYVSDTPRFRLDVDGFIVITLEGVENADVVAPDGEYVVSRDPLQVIVTEWQLHLDLYQP